jgi:hypothetical protein
MDRRSLFAGLATWPLLSFLKPFDNVGQARTISAVATKLKPAAKYFRIVAKSNGSKDSKEQMFMAINKFVNEYWSGTRSLLIDVEVDSKYPEGQVSFTYSFGNGDTGSIDLK